MQLAKKDDESQFDYHKRLIYGKLVDKTLSDVDYTELSKLAYGKQYSSDVARRMFYGSRYTLQLMDNERKNSCDGSGMADEIQAKTIELRKERMKMSDERSAFNKVIRERSRQEQLNDILTNAVKNGNLPTLDYSPVTIEHSDNDLLVSLNDIHYGIQIDNVWNTYNPEVCRQMMSDYLNKIIAIGQLHHSENCIVYNCGDSVSGRIHQTVQLANKENVIDQVKGVSELISEFLAELSHHFSEVRYLSVAGNHSRLEPNKANCPSGERLDDLIEWYLRARLQNFDNIVIADTHDRIDPTMFLTNIRGKVYCGVHGDFDGSNAKIAALKTMVQIPLYAILSGHLHHNQISTVSGVKTIMAGSFVGIDEYCVEQRIYGKPEQMVCVCTNDGVLCSYSIDL